MGKSIKGELRVNNYFIDLKEINEIAVITLFIIIIIDIITLQNNSYILFIIHTCVSE